MILMLPNMFSFFQRRPLQPMKEPDLYKKNKKNIYIKKKKDCENQFTFI